MQLEFWTQFKEYALAHGSTLRLRKAYPRHWYDISIGNSRSHLALVVDADNEPLRCELYIPDSKALFSALREKKEAIESKLPHELEWMELDGKKASRIRTIHTFDALDSAHWEGGFDWLSETAQQFQAVFADELKNMKI